MAGIDDGSRALQRRGAAHRMARLLELMLQGTSSAAVCASLALAARGLGTAPGSFRASACILGPGPGGAGSSAQIGTIVCTKERDREAREGLRGGAWCGRMAVAGRCGAAGRWHDVALPRAAAVVT